jgi:hypothetical protein
VFQALGTHPVAKVSLCVALHAAKLDELPAKMNKNAAKNSCSCFGTKLGKRHLQIALTHAAQTAKSPKDADGDEPGKQARQPTGQATQAACNGYNHSILKDFPHR